MGANDGAVDHQILVVPIRRQRLEHPLPDTGMAPAVKAPVYGLPFAIALRKIAPVCARVQHPQTSVHEQTVIHTRPARISHLARNQRCNLRPLRLAQLVPLDPYRSLRASTRMPMNQPSPRLGILNVDPA